MQGNGSRANPGYYAAIVALVLVLVTGLTLFLLLATRPEGSPARFAVSGPRAAPCPAGSGAPSCAIFTVTNTGGLTGEATCVITPTSGTEAFFLNDERVTTLLLTPNETRTLYAKVRPTEGNVVRSPVMACR
jgi:hypothetical protein